MGRISQAQSLPDTGNREKAEETLQPEAAVCVLRYLEEETDRAAEDLVREASCSQTSRATDIARLWRFLSNE